MTATRSAHLANCHRCGRDVLRGPDHDRVAEVVTVDPVPLDPLGEAVALLGGRATYELWGDELEARDPFKIRAGQKRTVLPAHDCRIETTPSPNVIAIFVETEIGPLEPMEAPF